MGARSPTELIRRLFVRGVPPVWAAMIGAATVVVVAVVVALVAGGFSHAGLALLLVVPVTVTAALGGRRPAQLVAAMATLAFTLVLPPVGSFRLRFADDTVALVVFFAVAFTTGTLVALRIEALARVERQQAALLRSVSHDLRTPLATIRAGISDLADEGLHDDATRQRLLELVSADAERLDRLVANLLSMARIEGGGLEPRRQAVDVAELVDDCTRRLDQALALAGVEVVVDLDPDLPPLLGDFTLLGQVMVNLLENASRHSPRGAPIDVRGRARGGMVELVVSDHGPGVPGDLVDAIFEPFRSGPTAGAGGIGLAICKAVVEAHGGTIAVGGSPRGGAAFSVSLPVA